MDVKLLRTVSGRMPGLSELHTGMTVARASSVMADGGGRINVRLADGVHMVAVIVPERSTGECQQVAGQCDP